MIREKSKTVGRSFRLNEKWLNVLNEEADNEKISPNALLNRILEDYCVYHKQLKRLPTVTLTQEGFAKIIGDCSKENLKLYGKIAGSATAKDIFSVLGLSFSKESITLYIKEILGHYANWFIYSHHVNGGKDVFHLRHSMGENWSIYVSEVLSTLLEHCAGQQVKKEYTKNTVTLEVALDKIPCNK